MKKVFRLLPLSLIALLAACSEDEVASVGGIETDGAQTLVTATTEPMLAESSITRVMPTPKNGVTGTGYTFPWQANDKISVFGSNADASGWGFFTLADGANTTQGKFSGIFKMLDDVSYYGFYPANGFTADADPHAIAVDYTGQTQTANASTAHLAPYVYQAGKADADGKFAFKHIDGLVRFNILSPLSVPCYKMVLSCDEPVFVNKGTINLTTATSTAAPDITVTETSQTFEVQLGTGSGIQAEDGMLTVYAMMAPAAVAGKDITLTLLDAEGASLFSEQFKFTADIAKGKAAYITCGSKTLTSIVLSSSVESGSELPINRRFQLSAEITPAIPVDQAVTWSTSDASIAEVTDTGLVTTVGLGEVTITATAKDEGEVKGTFTLHVIGTLANGHAYVDLGLTGKDGFPIYWATCNIGADAAEDSGLYFAWGETVGYTSDTKDGRKFNWASYKYCNGSSDKLSKYNTESRTGPVDNKTVLEPEDDAAHVNWGGDWRMPTKEEMDSLITKCTWTWDSTKKGYTVTSKTNGNTIFLPAAGYREEGNLNGVGSSGYYWSSSLSTTGYNSNSYNLIFYRSGDQHTGGNLRDRGIPVRPVCR